jgi:hypothetical protein
MSNLSDKEIDRLSREAAESYEPDHSSLSWSRLEQMLTEQMPERPPDGFRFGRINPYIWGPAVVLFAGLSFYLIKTKIYRSYSTQTSQSVNKPAPSAPAEKRNEHGNSVYADSTSYAPSSLKSSTDLAKNNKKPVSSDLKKPSAVVNSGSPGNVQSGEPDYSGTNQIQDMATAKSVSAKIKSGRKIPGSNKGDAASLVTAGTLRNGRSHLSGTVGVNNNGTETTEFNRSKGSTAISGTATASSGGAGLRNPLSLPSTVAAGSGLGKVRGNDSLLNRPNAMKTPIPHKSLRINRSLNFGFTFGPDYTDAGGISNNQFGNNVGLTAGYYLTNKLSVNTGILYSNKFFWSPGFGPQNPASGLTSVTAFAAPTIEYVNGAFNQYQLPLSLRYDFAKSDKSRFFVNAGLSSYFIINQTYIYFSHSGFRPSAWKRTDNSQENYWFGTADFSFGIETDLGKGFSFQAEPFLNIPLKQMGLENVKLRSYGIMLSFRYAPVLSRKKK